MLTSVHPEVDHQRFCLFECLPVEKKGGATCKNVAQSGTDKRRDHTGHGVIPLASNIVSFHGATDHAIKRHKVQVAEKKDDSWGSVLRKDAKSLNSHAALLAAKAKDELAKALAAEKSVKETMEKNRAVIPQMLASVAEAADAAKSAYAAQKVTEKIRDEVVEATRQEAEDVLQDTIKEEREKAHAKAKKEAKEKAEKLYKQMQEQAPKAAVAAMKPYNDALGRAAGISGQYQKRGDELGLESVGLQMKASMLLNESNQWMSLGEVPKAQQLLREAHATMDLAASLSGQANTMYNTGKSIVDTLGGYAAEAGQAAYHAEIMLNPDAPPPQPSLV